MKFNMKMHAVLLALGALLVSSCASSSFGHRDQE